MDDGSTEVVLSSPCGYFGESALWPFLDFRFATDLSGDPNKAAKPRSHFTGIRLVRDGNSWRCEASLEFSPTVCPVWIPFAELTGIQPDGPPSGRISFFPSDEKQVQDYEKFAALEVSRSFIEAAKDYAQVIERQRKNTDTLTEALALNVARFVEDLDPAYHENYELPTCDFSFATMSDWINANQEKLRQLRYEQIDGLLTDVASELLRKFLATLSSSAQHWQNKPLDLRIDLFLMASSDFFIFLSRILKLHWYLGHGGWEHAIKDLDGGFFRTSPPSLAWVLNHRDDAPWWARYRDFLVGQGEHWLKAFDDDNDEFRKHDLIALSRAWLWPEVYRLTKERVGAGDFVVLKPTHPDEATSVPWTFRKYLAKFSDWWTYRLTDNVIQPIFVSKKDLDNTDPEDTVNDLLDTWGTSLVSPNALSFYRKEVVEADNWQKKHDKAFPRVEAKLSINELLQNDRLGFALKEIETETEGETAWVRLVHNAVFEDAYGPRSLALIVEQKLRHRLFSVFGRNAIPFAFKDKSDHCQLMLREVVRRLLIVRHGDRWLKQGIPSAEPGTKARKVFERVKSKLENKDPRKCKELLDGSIPIDDFLRWTDISDYIDIIEDERNGIVVRREPRLTHYYQPLSKSLSGFRKWNDKRIAAAHPEKADELTTDDVAFLDDVKRILSVSILQEGPLQFSVKPV